MNFQLCRLGCILEAFCAIFLSSVYRGGCDRESAQAERSENSGCGGEAVELENNFTRPESGWALTVCPAASEAESLENARIL